MSPVVVGTSLAPRDQEKAWNKITCVNVTSNIITERLISEPAEQSFLGRGGHQPHRTHRARRGHPRRRW